MESATLFRILCKRCGVGRGYLAFFQAIGVQFRIVVQFDCSNWSGSEMEKARQTIEVQKGL